MYGEAGEHTPIHQVNPFVFNGAVFSARNTDGTKLRTKSQSKNPSNSRVPHCDPEYQQCWRRYLMGAHRYAPIYL